MKEEYVAEFSCSMPFRFLGEHQVTMCRNDGTIVRCKCGKPATCGIMGTDAYLAKCSECFATLIL